MAVVANPHAVSVLPEVHRVILMAPEGLDDFLPAQVGELGKRGGADVRMGAGVQRDGGVGELAEERTPDTTAKDELIAGEIAVAGVDAADDAVGHVDGEELGFAKERDAEGFRAFGDLFDGRDGADDAVAGDMNGTEDEFGVELGEMVAGFGGIEEAGVETPGARVPDLAFQIVPALGGGGDFEAAGWEPGGGVERRDLGEGAGGPLGEFRNGTRAVVLEDAAGSVGGRAAGFEERSAVDDEDIGAAELGQLPGGGDPDDAGADDDGLEVGLHRGLRAGIGWIVSVVW